jgi:hypothetical protein
MEIVSGELFKAALRKCSGVIAEGETPSAELMEDTRLAFNMLIDAWSADRLMAFSRQDQILTWPSGYETRTIGPTGQIVGLRPIRILDTSYFEDSGALIKEINMTMPDCTITLDRTPDSALTFHCTSVVELTQVPNLFTNLLLPNGYQRAFVYNLAVEMCAELGMEPSRTVQRIAISSKRTLLANNSPMDYLSLPNELLRLNSVRYNIFTGNF